MSNRIIISLRSPLNRFERSVSQHQITLPEYVKDELVGFVFDYLIFEIEGCRENPPLQRLGNFYRDHLENNAKFYKRFLAYFFDLLDDVMLVIKSHGLYHSDGFEFRPERFNGSNRSILIKKFDT